MYAPSLYQSNCNTRVSHGTILFEDIPRLNNCRAVGAAEFSYSRAIPRGKNFSLSVTKEAPRAERLDRDRILEREFY